MSVKPALGLSHACLLESDSIISLHLVVGCLPVLHNGRPLPSLLELRLKLSLLVQPFLNSRFVGWDLAMPALVDIVVVNGPHKVRIVE